MLAVQQQHFVRSDDPNGQRLDAISDAVDELNVQKFKAAHPELVAQDESPADAYAASQFDANKEKESFRQYEENSGPFKFYTCVCLHRLGLEALVLTLCPPLSFSVSSTRSRRSSTTSRPGPTPLPSRGRQ